MFALVGANMIELDWRGPLRLCRTEAERIPAEVPGVYVLHEFVPEIGGLPVFYVGRTGALRRRLGEHLSFRAKNTCIAQVVRRGPTYVSIAGVGDTETRMRIEAALIRVLSPPCNTETPQTNPAFVNLPVMRISSRAPAERRELEGGCYA